MTELVPAIDIIGGRCVRLRQGSFEARTDYDADPVELARSYARAGARRLHIVDLDGARTGAPRQLALAARMASESGLAVDFGGGVRAMRDAENVLRAGIAQVNIGSAAIRNPLLLEECLARFGGERIILAADARDGKVAAAGWAEQTDITLETLIGHFLPSGLAWALVTDIARDGMMTGPSLDLYRRLKAAFPGLELIASGGVSKTGDLADLDALGIERVVVGKALLEGSIPLSEIARHAG